MRKLTLVVLLFLTAGCGNPYSPEYRDAPPPTGGSAFNWSTPYTMEELSACATAPILGSWGDSEYNIQFRSDCRGSIPSCGATFIWKINSRRSELLMLTGGSGEACAPKGLGYPFEWTISPEGGLNLRYYTFSFNNMPRFTQPMPPGVMVQ